MLRPRPPRAGLGGAARLERNIGQLIGQLAESSDNLEVDGATCRRTSRMLHCCALCTTRLAWLVSDDWFQIAPERCVTECMEP
eukprot:8399252-Alexandrium_andersonii.AAC.1